MYAQVDQVRNIMVDNIEKVLERGERIELLVDKSEQLRNQVLLRSAACSAVQMPAELCCSAFPPHTALLCKPGSLGVCACVLAQ